MPFFGAPAAADEDFRRLRRARLASANLWRVIYEDGVMIRSRPENGARAGVDIEKGSLVEVAEEMPHVGDGWLRLAGTFGDLPPGGGYLPMSTSTHGQVCKRTLAPEGATLWRVTHDAVHVRAEPRTKAPIRGQRVRDTIVEVAEEMAVTPLGGRWLRVVPDLHKPDGVRRDSPVGEYFMYTWDKDAGPLLEAYFG